jgi:hypothetical protein
MRRADLTFSGLLAIADVPFLQGRAFVFASQFADALEHGLERESGTLRLLLTFLHVVDQVLRHSADVQYFDSMRRADLTFSGLLAIADVPFLQGRAFVFASQCFGSSL